MTSDQSLPPITRLFQVCDPLESLHPDDPRWVDFSEVRGEDNVVESFARDIRRARADGANVKLFSGHRGIGKTSELFRLKALLEKGGDGRPGFVVVYCDVSEKLDENDLDFPDLLVFVAAQLQQQLAGMGLPGFTVATTYLKRVWDDIRGMLGAQVELKEVELETGFAKLVMELRNRPTSRALLRDAVEKHSTSLLKAVNDLLGSAKVSANQAGRAGLVLIIDGLDKLVLRELENGGNTHDRLFIDRSEQLAALAVHTVYTVPISLIYSPRIGQLEQSIGEHTTPLSMIRLRPHRDANITPDSPGMQKMREMVAKRCDAAKLSVDDAFDDVSIRDYLCEMSGGHPRHLLVFLRAACGDLDTLPITRKAAERAVKRYALSLTREVPDATWPALRPFDTPQRDIPKDELHQQMLFLLYVFEYMNGEMWYEVNPVLRTVPRFHD